MTTNIRVALSSDHAAIGMRQAIAKHIAAQGWVPVDIGPTTPESTHYPKHGEAAARLVAEATAAVAGGSVPNELLALGADLVEVNAAVFDVLHDFAGCVPGVNEVLRQQGLVQTASVLGPDRLSPGQAGLIAQVRDSYPDLLDEDFVAENKDDWLS